MDGEPDTFDEQQPRQRFGWRFRLVTVIVSLTAALLLAEIALRVAGVRMGGIIDMGDHWCAFRHVPNRTLVHDGEGHAVVRINAVGIRDHETTVHKPPGVFRIAFLGDSFIEARQLDLDESVTKLLERRLNRYGRYEVLNFGMNGYSSVQQFLRLREFALAFEPDLVIFSVHTGNDVRDNHPALSNFPRPYFTVTADGGVELDTSFRRIDNWQNRLRSENSPIWLAITWLASNCRLVGVASEAIRRTLARPKAPAGEATIEGYRPGHFGNWEIYAPDPAPPWNDAWTMTEQTLLETGKLCRTHQIECLFLAVPNSQQIWDKSRRWFAEHRPDLDLERPDRRLSEFCAANGLRWLSLLWGFRDHYAATGDIMYGFGEDLGAGHWNRLGHRLAADAIFEYLIDQRLVPIER